MVNITSIITITITTTTHLLTDQKLYGINIWFLLMFPPSHYFSFFIPHNVQDSDKIYSMNEDNSKFVPDISSEIL